MIVRRDPPRFIWFARSLLYFVLAALSHAQELPLTRIAEARALSPAAVALRPAVRVCGVVTFMISHPASGHAEVTNFTVQE